MIKLNLFLTNVDRLNWSFGFVGYNIYIYILICLMLIWVQPRGAYASLLRSTSIYSMRTFQKIDPEFWCFLVKNCYPVWTLGSTTSVSPRRLMISNTAARTSDRFVGVKAWLMANQTRVKKGKPHSWLDFGKEGIWAPKHVSAGKRRYINGVQ